MEANIQHVILRQNGNYLTTVLGPITMTSEEIKQKAIDEAKQFPFLMPRHTGFHGYRISILNGFIVQG